MHCVLPAHPVPAFGQKNAALQGVHTPVLAVYVPAGHGSHDDALALRDPSGHEPHVWSPTVRPTVVPLQAVHVLRSDAYVPTGQGVHGPTRLGGEMAPGTSLPPHHVQAPPAKLTCPELQGAQLVAGLFAGKVPAGHGEHTDEPAAANLPYAFWAVQALDQPTPNVAPTGHVKPAGHSVHAACPLRSA